MHLPARTSIEVVRQLAALLAVAALLSPLAAAPAVAAEAYVCDGGRVVYVELADLERMKRTDACVAGYYGLTVEAPAAGRGAAGAKAASAATQSVTASSGAQGGPSPAAPATATVAAPNPSQFALRRTGPSRAAAVPAVPVRTIAMTRPSSGSAPVAARPPAPEPAPDTDFRNVRVINASAEADQWFHHND